jgi:hypothetical protein
MRHRHLAIRLEGLDDEIKYDTSLFSFIGEEFSKYKSKNRYDKYSYNLGTGFSLKTNDNDGYYYVSTEIKDKNTVYLIIDPDDGGGERFLGTINEIKEIILSILPEKYKNNKLDLFVYEDDY